MQNTHIYWKKGSLNSQQVSVESDSLVEICFKTLLFLWLVQQRTPDTKCKKSDGFAAIHRSLGACSCQDHPHPQNHLVMISLSKLILCCLEIHAVRYSFSAVFNTSALSLWISCFSEFTYSRSCLRWWASVCISSFTILGSERVTQYSLKERKKERKENETGELQQLGNKFCQPQWSDKQVINLHLAVNTAVPLPW